MKVGRQSVTDQVVAELRRQIIAGALPEGMALRQERLAAEFGVSRIPVREAIRQLAAEGLVVSEAHKGTVVSALSLREIEELFEIRVQFETWLFELAIPLLTEQDLAVAEEVTREASLGGTADNWGELNWRFHSVLYAPSGRTQALRLLKTVHQNADRYVNLQIAVSRDVERELSDHRQLLAFARLRDVNGGVKMLGAHIQRVARSLLTSIGERRREPGGAVSAGTGGAADVQ